MKARLLTGLLCLSLCMAPVTVFGADADDHSVQEESEVQANARMNDTTKQTVEQREQDANIGIKQDIDSSDVDVIDTSGNDEQAGAGGSDVSVDPVEDGSASTGMCTIVYRDGVDGKAFDEVSMKAEKGESTPTYMPAEDAYPGYEFESWSPKLSQTVTKSQVYTAQWKQVDPDINSDIDIKSDVVSNNQGSVASDNELINTSANKGTSQSADNSDLDNSGKEDAFADDVDSGDVNLPVLLSVLAGCLGSLVGLVAYRRKRLK